MALHVALSSRQTFSGPKSVRIAQQAPWLRPCLIACRPEWQGKLMQQLMQYRPPTTSYSGSSSMQETDAAKCQCYTWQLASLLAEQAVQLKHSQPCPRCPAK